MTVFFPPCYFQKYLWCGDHKHKGQDLVFIVRLIIRPTSLWAFFGTLEKERVAFLWKMILGVDEEAALLCCATLYDATAIYLWSSHVIQQLVIDMAWSCDKMASTLKPSVQWVHHYMQTVCLSKSIIAGDLRENNSKNNQQFQQAFFLSKIIEDIILSTSRNNHHGCNIHYWSTANMMLFVKYLVCSNSCMTIYICMWLQIYVILHSHMYVVLI